jgi:hypothetical protein
MNQVNHAKVNNADIADDVASIFKVFVFLSKLSTNPLLAPTTN